MSRLLGKIFIFFFKILKTCNQDILKEIQTWLADRRLPGDFFFKKFFLPLANFGIEHL